MLPRAPHLLRSLLLPRLLLPPPTAMPPKRAAAVKAKAKYHDSTDSEADLSSSPSSSGSDEPRPKKAAKKEQPAKKRKEAPPPPPPLSEGWVSMHTRGLPYVMYKRYGTPAYSGKVAAFDLDGTIVLPRLTSDASYAPVNATDWRFFNPGVPAKLKALVEEGYELVVLSNQGTIRGAHAGASAAKLTARVDAAVGAAGVPLTVVFATAASRDGSAARKPGTGMWAFYTSGGGATDGGAAPTRPPAAPPIDAGASFFCGDAAGRAAGENSAFPGAADFSDSDRAFAAAAGLADFRTPEAVFGPAEALDDFNARGGGGGGGAAGGGVEAGGGGGGGGAAPPTVTGGGGGPNARLAALFRAIAKKKEGFHARAVNNAAAVLDALATPIKDLSDAKGLKGIGKSSLAWIQEFLEAGDIADAHRALTPPPKAPKDAGALAFA